MKEGTSASQQEDLTDGQILSLKAVVDALLPPLQAPPDSKHINYWTHQLSTDHDFMEVLTRIVVEKLTPTNKFLLCGLLTALSTLSGTVVLMGSLSWSHLQAFTNWPLENRIEGINKMQYSKLLQRRQAYQSFKRLIFNTAFTYQQSSTGSNPFWEAMGYPGPPAKPPRDLVSPDVSLIWEPTMDDMKPKDPNTSDDDCDWSTDCDIVIVGSGAGGSVAAKVLSTAGYSVIVLEKGPYIPPKELTCLEGDSFDKLYDGHGLLTTSDSNIILLAGSTLGGGTTVNWSCCLPTPASVREEWVQEHQLLQFAAGGDFDDALNTVYKGMDIVAGTDNIKHNKNNRHLIEGCDRLGYRWHNTGQNVVTLDDATGFISFGDKFGLKRDARAVFLQKAVKYGTRILDRCNVTRILKSNSCGKTQRATGVLCRRNNASIKVMAKRAVVLATGSLHSPCLLLKSGFTNKHIGKHLRLHPATAVTGRIPESVRCFEGAPMTTVCTEFEKGPFKDGHGAKIECPSSHPGIAVSASQSISPAHFKKSVLSYANAIPMVVLQRDRGQGTVRLGRDGCPVVDYKLNSADKESIAATLQGALKILLACGVEECGTTHIRDGGLQANKRHNTKRDIEKNSAYNKYFEDVQRRGMDACEMCFFSAHQMGSCRMAAAPDAGVVDCNGEMFGCDDLFVLDASVFPSATGANPMVTVLSISQMLSERLAMRLAFEDNILLDPERKTKAERCLQRRSEMRSTSGYSLSFGLPFGLPSLGPLCRIVQTSVPVATIFWFWYTNNRRKLHN